jgi:hypothetical protein
MAQESPDEFLLCRQHLTTLNPLGAGHLDPEVRKAEFQDTDQGQGLVFRSSMCAISDLQFYLKSSAKNGAVKL